MAQLICTVFSQYLAKNNRFPVEELTNIENLDSRRLYTKLAIMAGL
jgi:hypothetical protein